MERQAAKFTSAEQEAAQRKAELTSLKNSKQEEVVAADIAAAAAAETAATCATESSVVSDGVDAAVPAPVQEASTADLPSTSGVAAAIRNVETAATAEAAPALMSPRPSGKRNSVLNAHPELLNTLNKMFSPGGGMGAGPASVSKVARRNSTVAVNLFPKDATAVEGGEKDTDKEVVKTVKKTQSKLLKVRCARCLSLSTDVIYTLLI